MSAGSPAILVALLLLVPASAVVGGASAHTQASEPSGTISQVSAPPPVNTTLWISLEENGDAHWTVSANFTLTDENESAAFRDLAQDFEAGETAELGLPTFRAAADRAAAVTNRSMEIHDPIRSTELRNNETFGVLRLEFTWTSFGEVDNETLKIGDAFAAGDWFPGLEPSQKLVIQAPPAYGVVNSEVAPNNGTLQWVGPASFPEGELVATFTGESTGTGPTPTTPPPTWGSSSWLWIGLGVLVLGGGGVMAYVLARRRPDDESSAPAVEPETEVQPVADEDEPADESMDEELLSDEERVERLLEQNGGRMKQATIVNETGWSNAKVSQLLSAMDEEGRIDKLRIGRENLISFPDEDVTDLEE